MLSLCVPLHTQSQMKKKITTMDFLQPRHASLTNSLKQIMTSDHFGVGEENGIASNEIADVICVCISTLTYNNFHACLRYVLAMILQPNAITVCVLLSADKWCAYTLFELSVVQCTHDAHTHHIHDALEAIFVWVLILFFFRVFRRKKASNLHTNKLTKSG